MEAFRLRLKLLCHFKQHRATHQPHHDGSPSILLSNGTRISFPSASFNTCIASITSVFRTAFANIFKQVSFDKRNKHNNKRKRNKHNNTRNKHNETATTASTCQGSICIFAALPGGASQKCSIFPTEVCEHFHEEYRTQLSLAPATTVTEHYFSERHNVNTTSECAPTSAVSSALVRMVQRWRCMLKVREMTPFTLTSWSEHFCLLSCTEIIVS